MSFPSSKQLEKYLSYGWKREKKQQQQLTTYRDNKDILLYVSSLCLGIQGSGKWRGGGGGGGGNGKGKKKRGPWNSLLTSFRVCLQQSTHTTETTKITYYN